jgi:hypothetical protein
MILGNICRLTSRHDQAKAYYSTALKLDPLLWQAFEELCLLGAPRQTD